MKLIIFLIVAYLFYILTRSYKSSDFQKIDINKKQVLKGELEEHEAGLIVSMMAKVAKADGKVCELEAEILSHTFTDVASTFENSEEIREKLKNIYSKEKESFDNTLVIAQKYLKLTKKDYFKRLKVMEYLLNLAFIDDDFSNAEFMITEDIANALELKREDFENLIAQFEQFYAKKREHKVNNLQKAYQILGADDSDDLTSIKKKYRALVKANHPDIIAGSGAEQSIIDAATAKLQEINEAYELLKKHKGN